MKNKIIMILIGLILIMLLYFQYYKIETEKKKIKMLEEQIEFVSKKNKLVLNDLVKSNKEKEIEHDKNLILQKKLKTIIDKESNSCLNYHIPTDLRNFMLQQTS